MVGRECSSLVAATATVPHHRTDVANAGPGLTFSTECERVGWWTRMDYRKQPVEPLQFRLLSDFWRKSNFTDSHGGTQVSIRDTRELRHHQTQRDSSQGIA